MVELSTTLGGLASLCGVLLFLSAATLGLRFLARFRQKTGLLLDDYIAGGAFVRFLSLTYIVAWGLELMEPIDWVFGLECSCLLW